MHMRVQIIEALIKNARNQKTNQDILQTSLLFWQTKINL